MNKRIISVTLIAILTLLFSIAKAQTYNFSEYKKGAILTGGKIRTIKSNKSNYRFVFETATTGEELFTILNANQSSTVGLPYFMKGRDEGYKEIDGDLFRVGKYAYTGGSGEVVTVYIEEDYRKIILLHSNNTVEFYLE